MTTAPAYLPEIVAFVQHNLNEPVKVGLALASLLTDDQSTTDKSGAGPELKEFVSHWLLTDPEVAEVVADPAFPVQRELIDGIWTPVWKAARHSTGPSSFKYNVCISFAGKDRAIAEGIAKMLVEDSDLKRKVFYDEFEKTELWGEDLFSHLHRIYSVESMYCVILFSHAYIQRAWTRHELRAAQTRILEDRRAYVLPVAIDAGAIPPEFASVGYWPYQPNDETGPLPAAIEAKISDFIGTNYMTSHEIAESLKRNWICRALLDGFTSALAAKESKRAALVIVAICAAWDVQQSVSADIPALLRLVLFSPGVVSDLFTHDSIEIDTGYFIRRSFTSRELFLLSNNWTDRIKRYFPADWDFNGSELDEDSPGT